MNKLFELFTQLSTPLTSCHTDSTERKDRRYESYGDWLASLLAFSSPATDLLHQLTLRVVPMSQSLFHRPFHNDAQINFVLLHSGVAGPPLGDVSKRDVASSFFSKALSITNEAPFTSIVFGWKLTSQETDISEPGLIKLICVAK